MNVAEARKFWEYLPLTRQEEEKAGHLRREVLNRLIYLDEVGLSYLTLDRQTRTLSGGESQRINLAAALGSQLTETLYVIDEPTVGLHARDSERLLAVLHRLRTAGNTVVVVEHDPTIIAGADHLIELGPGAGEFGGEVQFAGDVSEPEAQRRIEALQPGPVDEPASQPDGGPRDVIRIVGATRAQPQGNRRRNPSRKARRRHRRVRVGQVDTDPRLPLQRISAAVSRCGGCRRRGVLPSRGARPDR